MSNRIEKDTMGEMEVPEEALWGASTQRAVLNFPVSGQTVDSGVIHGFGLIKWAAAKANAELGIVPEDKTSLIEQAAQEVYEGKLDEHFVVDRHPGNVAVVSMSETGSATPVVHWADRVASEVLAEGRLRADLVQGGHGPALQDRHGPRPAIRGAGQDQGRGQRSGRDLTDDDVRQRGVLGTEHPHRDHVEDQLAQQR